MAEVWTSVQRECPRRIRGELHASGQFEHGTSARFPGKVLCCEAHTAKPEGWVPTERSYEAWQGAGLCVKSSSPDEPQNGICSRGGIPIGFSNQSIPPLFNSCSAGAELEPARVSEDNILSRLKAFQEATDRRGL